MSGVMDEAQLFEVMTALIHIALGVLGALAALVMVAASLAYLAGVTRR